MESLLSNANASSDSISISSRLPNNISKIAERKVSREGNNWKQLESLKENTSSFNISGFWLVVFVNTDTTKDIFQKMLLIFWENYLKNFSERMLVQAL